MNDVVTRASGQPDSRLITITRARSSGLPSGGITYSLNIANSTDAATSVLARPSLVAIDRQPSTFFSGNTVTFGISGLAGASSTVGDRPFGVSMSVTPTFVSDDEMLLSVRATRSFLEAVNSGVTFDQALQSSRNVVNANVVIRFGQTLILSGLAEQEIERDVNGVPVLQDIPVLRYLFRNKTTLNFMRSVLILVTPRRPVGDTEEIARVAAEIKRNPDNRQYALKEKLLEHLDVVRKSLPNLDAAYAYQLRNRYYLQFRDGDLSHDYWGEDTRFEVMMKKLGEMLYF